MGSEGIPDIRALAELLKPDGNESPDSDEDLPDAGLSKLGSGPGQIGRKSDKSSTHEKNFEVKTLCGNNIPDTEETKSHDTKKAKYVPDEFDIWRADELENRTGEERWDPREQPEYDIKYRQAVTTEDLYLQMGGKTTATASCEDMVVTIYLEGEHSRHVIDLSLTETQLDIRSPLYRLCLHLPHPINPEAGNAVWNKKEHTLVVTLRMIRELDLINF